MSDVGQQSEAEQPAASPGRIKAVAATVLGALSLVPPSYFLIVMTVCMIGLIACLANFAIFQRWRVFF
ncbi:hypothetical protein [Gulosibacter sp. ACHW.36C]|uniref:Uncharacterized protein n=1 Tax=Gulosibacter sediminis TaxID=1729695 RepID=A0ABY4MXJ2_9MICO|nr:hypothetical protein [Gulosibacter sediminis]UQN15153.1 hypothetical protein M3M28_01405 [Gulosibacter sediminis]